MSSHPTSTLIPLAQATAERVGGKAAGLRLLLERGCPVPPTLCLPVDVYRDALAALGPPPSIADDPSGALIREHFSGWYPSAELTRELELAVTTLGWPLIARSSATCESVEEMSTSGVFRSRGGLRDLLAVLDAIREVWASLWERPARALLQLQQRSPTVEAMAILLQHQIEARAAGVIASRDDREPESLRLEVVAGPGRLLADGEKDPTWFLLPRHDRSPPSRQARWGALPGAVAQTLREATLTLEAHWGQTVEVEWIFDGERVWLVQARPTRPRPAPAPFPLVWQRSGDEERTWRWDREHNPNPLSPAHSSLIALLDERRGTQRHMVQGGYLFNAVEPEAATVPATFTKPEAATVPATFTKPEAVTVPATFTKPEAAPVPQAKADLTRRWHQLRVEAEQALLVFEAQRPTEGDLRPGLEAALTFFFELVQSYTGPLAQARRAAWFALDRFLAEQRISLAPAELGLLTAGDRSSTLAAAEDLFDLARAIHRDRGLGPVLEQVDTERDPAVSDADRLRLPPEHMEHLRRHLDVYGSLTQVWDLAAPTLAEEPHRLLPRLRALAAVDRSPVEAHRRALAQADALAAAIAGRLPTARRARLHALVAEARLARTLAEDDDLLFSRGLRVVRRALLRGGDHLVEDGRLDRPADIFLLEILEVLTELQDHRPRTDLRPRVARRQQRVSAQLPLVPPHTITAGRPNWPTPPSGSVVLRGLGVGGVRRGLVRLLPALDEVLAARDLRQQVVVCPTLLPALAVVLVEAAALVTDHGGLLSHAACLARELGVPAVVGTGSATRELHDGEEVWVDGERGLVVRDVLGPIDSSPYRLLPSD